MKSLKSIALMWFRHLAKSTVKILLVALAVGLTTAAFAQDSITVANPSFDEGFNPVWPHYTTTLPMAGWNAGTAAVGINEAADGPFWDNGRAVDGTYVGFIQNDGLLGQPSTGFQVGETYWIQIFVNARIDTDTPDISVFHSASTAGGSALVPPINITPVGGAAGTGNPFTFINVPFTAATNQGDLNILKTAHISSATNNGSAAVLLLDGFSIIRRSPNDVVIANPSFEASGTNQVAPGYLTAIAGWTLSGAANGFAINQSGGAFADNGTIPDGGNVLVVQSARSVSQVLQVSPGVKYQLSLYANSRAGSATPTAQVTIGGNTAYNGTVTAVGASNPYTYQTYTFTAASANVTLAIVNTTAAATDSALLVDNVRLVKLPESITVANPSFENAPIPNGAGIGLGPIPGWAGGSGVNNASGPFWDNGSAPDSSYVGFKQGAGLTGQPLTGFEVGETYWIQFFANARSGGDTCDMAVYNSASTLGGAPLVSGLNITPVGGGNPFTFINVPFTAAATNGDLNIKNTPHTGGDATLLFDGFSIIRRSTNDIVIMNPSFEASGTGQASPGIVAKVAGWTLTGPGPYLINQAGGPYLDGGGVVPDGQNVLIVQEVSAFSQTLHGLTPGGNYRLTLYLNGRAGNPQPTALVTIDGQTVYNAPVPQLVNQPFQLVSFDFVASAADVTLSIGGTGGNSYYVDNVRVYAPTPIAPTVDAQPTGGTRYAGASFTLTAAVSGYPTPQLQWKRDGNIITGETNATLVLSSLQLADAGSYVLYATNLAGSTNTTAAVLTVLPVTSDYAGAVIAQNPMGYWRFSDGGGTNAFDYVGDNNAYDTNYQNNGGSGPATLLAGPQPPAFPGLESTNTAPFLDGLSQGYASSVSLFNNRSNFTIMGWFKIDPSQYPFVEDAFAHPQGRASLFGQQWAAELGFYQGTNLYFYATGITPGTIFVTNGFNPGGWHFVAVVSDAGANTTKVYLDGVVAGTANACPGTTNSYLFSIGKNVAYFPSGGYDNAFFPGSLDEVAAFGHALSGATIQALYNTGLGVSSVNQSPTNITVTVSAGQMTLAWPQDHTGWVLEAQTNSLSTGLGTNWVRLPSSATTNQFTVPVSPADPTVFYRLVYP